MSDVSSFVGPHSSVDLWSDEALIDPFGSYAALRDLGPAVWLDRHDLVALPRYAEVRDALANWRVFSSAAGVGVDAEANALLANSGVLGTDPPEHTALRRAIGPELSSRRLGHETARIRRVAESTVEPLLGGDVRDAVGELARPYVAGVVRELLGLPQEAVDDLPVLAARAFDLFGPALVRQRDGLQAFQRIVGRAVGLAEAARSPSSGALDGEVSRLVTYLFPGVDTTVQAVSAAVHLFAQHPDQWARLRSDPGLMPGAVSEVLRLHSPVRSFTRLVTTTVTVGATRLAPGTRVLILYASANRDERRFAAPETFDITRPAHQHMAFGHGVHHCAGANLARLELACLLEVLLPRVRRMIVREPPSWDRGLVIHGLEVLPVSFETVGAVGAAPR